MKNVLVCKRWRKRHLYTPGRNPNYLSQIEDRMVKQIIELLYNLDVPLLGTNLNKLKLVYNKDALTFMFIMH